MQMFRSIVADAKTKIARENSRIIIGPWSHAGRGKSYQTEPLEERIEVTGNPVVELYASSSAADTDFFVRLIDVAPSGIARDVSLGMVRARYRHGLDKPQLLKLGEVDRNHNTAADQNADAVLKSANQTIHQGGKQSTRIVLPWVTNREK